MINKDIVSQFKTFLVNSNGFLETGSDELFIASDGTSYPKRQFESDFHRQLEVELADPDKAAAVYHSFRAHLEPILTAEEKGVLEGWILKNVRFIGAFPFFSHWKGEREVPVEAILSAHPFSVNNFFEEIRLSEKPCVFPVNKDPSEPKNIVIITTTGGGGHKSVAEALQQILMRFPEKYHVTIVDVANQFKPSDPLYRLSGLLSAEEIYDRIYQQAGETQLAHDLWALKTKLISYVPNTGMKDLKDRIRPLNPDLVISTCHFLDRDLEVASALGVPLRFAHCDYELSWALAPLILRVNAATVKLWLPANDPQLLHPTSSVLKSELVQQLCLSHSEQEVDEMIEKGSKTTIEYPGYPVRPSFVKESDSIKLNEIRARFGVAEGSKVVTVQMGRQGVSTLDTIVRTLCEDCSVVYDHPLHIAVMCGKNDELREELLDYIAKREKKPGVHFEILPFLDEKDTADYLKITDVMLMKPGGAATAEALEMGVNTLIFVDPHHPWEGCNKDQMVRHGIGTVVESIGAIPQQLKEVLSKEKNQSYQPIKAIEAVPGLVDEAIRTYRVFKETLPPFDYGIHVHSLPKNLKIDHQKLAENFLQTEGNTSDPNIHLDQFFGHVYLLNLEKCVDKKNSILQRLRAVGLMEDKIEVVKATYGRDVYTIEERKRMKDNSFGIDESTEEGRQMLDKQHAGQMGCWKSHERIIRDAKEHYDAAKWEYDAAELKGFVDEEEKKRLEAKVKEYSSILIFEDDAGLGFRNADRKTFNTQNLKEEIWNCMKELPEKWDMFYFLPYRLKPVLEQKQQYQYLSRENYSVALSTVAINASMYDVLLRELDKINQEGVDLIAVDHVHARLQKDTLCYGPTRRPLAFQTDSPSDISGLDRNHELWQPLDHFNLRSYITYSLDSNGRFGDQLSNYIRALQLSKKYGIPLLYKPIDYGDSLELSQKYNRLDTIDVEGYKKIKSDSTVEKYEQLKQELEKSKEKNGVDSTLYEVSFYTPCYEEPNEEFRNELRELIKPRIPIKSPIIPQGYFSVALHVRRGGNFDTQSDKDKMPTKFPPDSFYIKSLCQIAQMKPNEKIFVRIFTDDLHPEKIKESYERYLEALGINNITLVYEDYKPNTDTVLEDFFAMAEFDCLIRSDSSFSHCISQISGPVIEITPPGWDEIDGKDQRGRPVIGCRVVTRKRKGGNISSIQRLKVENEILSAINTQAVLFPNQDSFFNRAINVINGCEYFMNLLTCWPFSGYRSEGDFEERVDSEVK